MEPYRDDAASQYSGSENLDRCAQAIRKALVEHNCGGFIVVVNPEGAASFSESPKWAGVRIEAGAGGEVALNFDVRTVDQANAAIHFLSSITYYCFQFGALFRHFNEQCVATLKAAGIYSGEDPGTEEDEVVMFSPLDDEPKGN